MDARAPRGFTGVPARPRSEVQPTRPQQGGWCAKKAAPPRAGRRAFASWSGAQVTADAPIDSPAIVQSEKLTDNFCLPLMFRECNAALVRQSRPRGPIASRCRDSGRCICPPRHRPLLAPERPSTGIHARSTLRSLGLHIPARRPEGGRLCPRPRRADLLPSPRSRNDLWRRRWQPGPWRIAPRRQGMLPLSSNEGAGDIDIVIDGSCMSDGVTSHWPCCTMAHQRAVAILN